MLLITIPLLYYYYYYNYYYGRSVALLCAP